MTPEEFAPGTKLAGYKIESYIDGGQFSEVFSVTNKKKESFVAKIFLQENSGDMFERELSIVKKLPNEPYFGYFVDIVEMDTWKILILANCGVSLKTALEQKESRKFSSPNTVKIGLQLLNALKELHNLGLLHRDVHLGNVTCWLYNGAPCISLIDYGLTIEDGGARTKHTKSQDILDIFTIMLESRSIKRNVFRVMEYQENGTILDKKEPHELMGMENTWIWDIYKTTKAQHGFPVPYDTIRSSLENALPNFDATKPLEFTMTATGMLLE